MNTNPRITTLLTMLAILLPAFTLLATETATVSDLAGQWHGKSHFSGINYEEATQKKVAAQDVETVLHISADGKVTGRVGGAELRDCVVESNRGWFGRLLNIKTDFIIRGKIAGVVAIGSESGTNTINAPFNLPGNGIKGTIFITHPFTYPYPFLDLRLSREP